MKIKFILLLALAFNYNSFAAQANEKQLPIKTVMHPGFSQEGHEQRIIIATYGEFLYRKTITYRRVKEKGGERIDVHSKVYTNVENDRILLTALDSCATICEQKAILFHYLPKLKLYTDQLDDYIALKNYESQFFTKDFNKNEEKDDQPGAEN